MSIESLSIIKSINFIMYISERERREVGGERTEGEQGSIYITNTCHSHETS